MRFKGPLGIVGERVLQIIDAEARHNERAVTRLNGFTALLDSFQDFALHTVDEAKTHNQVANVFSFALVSAAFRRFRAALNVFYSGYYYDAASHLRSVFESVFYLGAAAHGYIRFDAIFAAANRIDANQVSVRELLKMERKVRHEIDRTINDKMRGKDSGLSPTDQEHLEDMFFVLHAHVHKASSSVIAFLGEMWSEKKVPSIATTFELDKASQFCNVAVCAAWAFTRVLPCVSSPSRFSEEWHERYRVLDASLHSYLTGWDTPVGLAYRRFMGVKMNFTDESFKRFAIDREHGAQ